MGIAHLALVLQPAYNNTGMPFQFMSKSDDAGLWEIGAPNFQVRLDRLLWNQPFRGSPISLLLCWRLF